MSRFKQGQVITLKSDKSITGAIVNIMEGYPETRYQVFTAAGMQTYYESQIDIQESDEEMEKVNAERFNAGLTASLIRNPSISSLYSLNTAKIDFIPHQFRPVLKFIRADRPRLLIADGVGVGKTIEAGLILRELQARRNLDSVLIICPRPLVSERKWEEEMKRFGEEFTALDGDLFRHCINELDMEGEWPEKYKKAIIPYSLFDESNVFGNKKHKGLMEVDPPEFDLVIVDEAHHIRNTATYGYRAVSRFCDAAEAVVLLTATPVQLQYDDLFVLLNLLRPDLIIDRKTFQDMAEPNQFINMASTYVRGFKEGWKENAYEQIINACNTSWGKKVFQGNPTMERIIRVLNQNEISVEERVQLISDIENMHTFSNLISRTRRRDIGEFTIRKPYTVTVEFTPEQRELHDKVLEVVHEIFSTIHCTDNTKFMMTTIRRQTASCLFGLAPMLRSILYRHLYEITDNDDESIDLSALNHDKSLFSIQEQIEEILEIADALPDEDPKFDALMEIVKKKQTETKNKLMIFSSFRHTLHYLYNKLTEQGLRVGLIHGDVIDEERRELRKRFNPNQTPCEDKTALDILLFSEVGCEGLDYQFCDCMVNYDLPWNPMKVEQRIGRIDRNGQTSESCKKKDVLNLTLDEYQKYADDLTNGFVEAEKILQEERIFSSKDLPYSTQFIPLAVLCTILSKNNQIKTTTIKNKIKQWYWCGVFGEMYGSANETRYVLDVVGVMDWISDDTKVPKTVQDSYFNPTRLLSLQSRLSAAYKGIMALILKNHCQDFISGREMDFSVYKAENIDIHHIFPKDYCEKQKYDKAKWNSVINKTPITYSTNREIGGVAPSVYLTKIENKGQVSSDILDTYLTTHWIDVVSCRNDNFQEHIIKRAKMLLNAIEKATGKSISGRDSEDVVNAFGGKLS